MVVSMYPVIVAILELSNKFFKFGVHYKANMANAAWRFTDRCDECPENMQIGIRIAAILV